MEKVCVITGGGSGIGLATAELMSKEKIIVLSGRTVSKLEKAVNELTELGFTAYPFACDTSDRESVRRDTGMFVKPGSDRNRYGKAGREGRRFHAPVRS
jgi:NAD(P)-dependent dehydrogenase (short-subunit alcohol dehydrogenase family)